MDDGPNTYTYDAANRLTSVVGNGHTSTYGYSGLGDRLSQTVDSVTTDYALDLNTGLTQVLDDGNNTYLYGNGRIGELQPSGFAYHLGDALGSVRQLMDDETEVTLVRSYEPYGNTLTSAGPGSTVYQYTGEIRDASGLIFLRARYLSSETGRLISRDSWQGNNGLSLSLNKYLYATDDPVNYIDPSGYCRTSPSTGFARLDNKMKADERDCWRLLDDIETQFPFIDLRGGLNNNWFLRGENYWTAEELEIVKNELVTFDNAMTGKKLNQVFAGPRVTLKRERYEKLQGGGATCGESVGLLNTIWIYDSKFLYLGGCKGTVGHELAHQWDHNEWLSDAFVIYIHSSVTTGWFFPGVYDPGPERPPSYGVTGIPPNQKEDFAESLEEYVYETNDEKIVQGGLRWTFIEYLLSIGEPIRITAPLPPTPCTPESTPMPGR